MQERERTRDQGELPIRIEVLYLLRDSVPRIELFCLKRGDSNPSHGFSQCS